MLVVKKGGNRQPFTRDKLIAGLTRACEKRPVNMAQIEQLEGEIERDLRDNYDREVSSRTIGEMVMDRLQSLDEVAYVRFASVYRQFTDLNRFIKTIDQLKKSRY